VALIVIFLSQSEKQVALIQAQVASHVIGSKFEGFTLASHHILEKLAVILFISIEEIFKSVNFDVRIIFCPDFTIQVKERSVLVKYVSE